MFISKNGLTFIKEFEGLSLTPYRDVAGVPTIGYGNTYYDNGLAVKMTDSAISEEEASHLLKEVLRRYENAVTRYVRVPITQNQFDALVSFAYNVGNEALRKSTLLKKLNNNEDCSDEFFRWIYANGEKIQGLVRRRAKERALFLKD